MEGNIAGKMTGKDTTGTWCIEGLVHFNLKLYTLITLFFKFLNIKYDLI